MTTTDDRTEVETTASIEDHIGTDGIDWHGDDVQIRTEGSGLVLSPRGALCSDTIGALVEALAKPVVRDHPHVVVDLRGVDLLCAAGVTVLVEERQRRRPSGRSLTLRDPSPLSARVLGICQIPLADIL